MGADGRVPPSTVSVRSSPRRSERADSGPPVEAARCRQLFQDPVHGWHGPRRRSALLSLTFVALQLDSDPEHTLFAGTSFVPDTISSEQQIVSFLTLVDQPFTINPPLAFQQDVARLLQLYPDNPALGSPFGTGNETFGLSSQYKRAAALVGDVCFEATRREWIRAASRAGVQVYGYLFTDHNAVEIPSRGGESVFVSGFEFGSGCAWMLIMFRTVTHALEIPYVFGLAATNSTNAAVRLLSQAMVDYWISFTVSLTPNDGRGLPSECPFPFTAHRGRSLILNYSALTRNCRDELAAVPVQPPGSSVWSIEGREA